MERFRYERNLQVGKIGFNAATQEEIVRMIRDIPLSDVGATVVFTGVPGVVLAEKMPQIAEIQNGSTLCCMDGMPIARIAKKAGIPSERCGGPDVMLKVIEDGLKSGKRHYFYGSTPETLKKLEQKLREKYPDIVIAGKFSPPFRELTPEEDKEVIKIIRATHPDYVWVGLGAPKQDIWMENHCAVLPQTVILGVGAAFSFHSDKVKRAPLWVQKSGLEWLYRMLREPGRLWKRYLSTAPRFLVIRHKTLKGIRRAQKAAKKHGEANA